jgi:hypothetical protein
VVWRAITWVAVITAAIVQTSCLGVAPIKPKGKAVVPLNTDVRIVEAKVPLLAEVVIELPAIANPDNQWLIVYNDARFLRPLRRIEPAAVGKGFTARFLAIRDGRRSIRFFALHPGRREAVPSQTYEVRIEIE